MCFARGSSCHPCCPIFCKHHWGTSGLPRARSHSFVPTASWPSFPEISLNITDPLWSQKNLWSLNQISSSRRWSWNRVSFVNTEDRLWVVKHIWPYMGADCSIHREAQVPGGKRKSVKKGLWNKIIFYLETEQKVWLNLWNTGMVCYFLWTSKVYVCLWWR